MDIIAININQIHEDTSLWGKFIPLMDPVLQTKIHKFRNSDDQLRTLCGEMLVHIYGSEHWKLSAFELTRKVNSYGKPEFTKFSKYQYNISHSGCWVVAAFDDNPIGIDIEGIIPIDLQIADQFFAVSEAKTLHMQEEERKLRFFYHLWTLKESYIKAKGEGLSIPLNSFAFELSEHGDIYLHPESESDSSWYFRQYSLDPSYALAVCGKKPQFPDQIEVIEWNEFTHRFQAALKSG